MLDGMIEFGRDRAAVRIVRSGAARVRRGSVLVLVMAILGILFVTGVAFLMTMNFETRLVGSEQEDAQNEAGVTRVRRLSGAVLRKGFIATPGVTGGTDDLISPAGFVNPLTWAELPAVHGLISQIEPYETVLPPPQSKTIRAFGYVTDLKTMLQTEKFDKLAVQDRSEIPVFNENGIGDLARVDADGDGFVDARQVDLSTLTTKDVLTGYDKDVFPHSHLAALAKAVNDPSRPSDKVYLGLRVIPHGGMIDLDDSHPLLIQKLFDLPDYVPLDPMELDPVPNPAWVIGRQRPYLPALEEPSLRRRFNLAPRLIPLSAVQGDPTNGTADQPVYDGDFEEWLFPPPWDQGGKHQYWPFARRGASDQETEDRWWARLDPEDDGYELRHLVTTISHDDNLTRGAKVEHRDSPAATAPEPVDVLDLMVEASGPDSNTSTWGSDSALRFQYVAYPHAVAGPNGLVSGYCTYPKPVLEGGYDCIEGERFNWCQCQKKLGEARGGCSHDLRKGRLRLSLPWLDDVTDKDGNITDEEITQDQRTQLIYEAFTMLLLNARSTSKSESESEPEWGKYVECDVDGDSLPDIKMWRHNANNIALTAASLTANMIDFADADDVPTRVEIRWLDFDDITWNSCLPEYPPTATRDVWLQRIGKGTCELEAEGIEDVECQYVYGLERQPFITEVAADIDDIQPPGGDGNPDSTSAWAVELFNPYDRSMPLDAFYLKVKGKEEIPLSDVDDLPAKGFYVLFTANDDQGGGLRIGSVGDKKRVQRLEFDNENANIIFLLRDNPDSAADPIVVDQFELAPDGQVGQINHGDPGIVWSLGRNSVGDNPQYGLYPWFAPIPADPADKAPEEESGPGHTLGAGNDNGTQDTDLRQVEVLFANTGEFGTAFPTTGSLLLLMRHANRSIHDADEKLAFTSHLRESVQVDFEDPGSPIVEVSTQIDNGRMPVFDVGLLHHVDPAKAPGSGSGWEGYRPGELMHLPWGQLVFDYFTAVPLSNFGPYPYTGNPSDMARPDVKPRVDQEGLRVHGRININAAPWRVLAGLPYVPMEDVPAAFCKTFWDTLLPSTSQADDGIAYPLGKKLAKAIVGYRELRDGGGVAPETGDYGDMRGWAVEIPTARRGTGFLTVGELANVRSPDPANEAYRPYRMDCGKVDDSSGTYLEAIAVLACLGDWVTVRSHVFTVYGVLRGAENPDPTLPDAEKAAEVDSRALRFQETMDRLPTFLGESAPVRICDRTVCPYQDALND